MKNVNKSWEEVAATRRFFIQFTFLSTLFAMISGTIYPVFRYLMPTKKGRAVQKQIQRVKLQRVPIGEAYFFKFKRRVAVLIRKGEKEVIAMSAVCTHLGCIVKFSPSDMLLKCPCHGAIFDMNGRVLAGPAPRPLPLYRASIEGQNIIIEEA